MKRIILAYLCFTFAGIVYAETCFVGVTVDNDNNTVSDVYVQIYKNACTTPELHWEGFSNKFGIVLDDIEMPDGIIEIVLTHEADVTKMYFECADNDCEVLPWGDK